MRVRELDIAGAWEFTPTVFPDDRGLFTAPYQRKAVVDAVGYPLVLAQSNHSVSRRGTIRGVHFADVPPSQAKYIYCPRGAALDVIVDLRVGSPTFGQWISVNLDPVECRAVYLAEGLGHAFMALEANTVLTYLCSTGYNPSAEHGVTPLDAQLNLPWPADVQPVLSEKDRYAPTLAEAKDRGILPNYAECLAYYDTLRTRYKSADPA